MICFFSFGQRKIAHAKSLFFYISVCDMPRDVPNLAYAKCRMTIPEEIIALNIQYFLDNPILIVDRRKKKSGCFFRFSSGN